MEERRRSRRAVPTHEVLATLGGHRKARILDISTDGALLDLAMALSPNARCHLSLHLPGGMVRVRARVTRCRLIALADSEPKGHLVYRAAVEFVDLDPNVATEIRFAFPPPVVVENERRELIEVGIDVGARETAHPGGDHGAN